MLNYTFSKREKVLLLVLAAILVFMLWYLLVWQGTVTQVQLIDADIAEVEAQTLVERTKATRQNEMLDTIEQQKAAGVSAAQLPAYDNTTALMAQLNTVLSSTTDYKLTFDDLNFSSDGVVARGVTISFGCASIDEARSVMRQLSDGPFACTVDAASVASTDSSDNRTTNARVGVNVSRNVDAPYAAGIHVTFYEAA